MAKLISKKESKKWVIKFRTKDRINFLEIKNGKKKVETRAATDKYRKIIKEDTLVFVCGKERLKKKIKKVQIFKSLDAMFKVVNPKHIMPSIPTTLLMKSVYYNYPDYKEKLREFGVIAWWI